MLQLELHRGFESDLQTILCSRLDRRAVPWVPWELHCLDSRLELDELMAEAKEVIPRGEHLFVDGFSYATVVQPILIRVKGRKRHEYQDTDADEG